MTRRCGVGPGFSHEDGAGVLSVEKPQFGLPAAMIVLVLVFGALVAASIPMSIAIVSITVAVAISSVVGQFTSLSFFIVNMTRTR
jgi:hypothetical protein